MSNLSMEGITWCGNRQYSSLLQEHTKCSVWLDTPALFESFTEMQKCWLLT